MSPSIAEANETLRNAVEARREAQAAGKPLEEWYDVSQATTKPRCFDASTEEMQHVTLGYDTETIKAARDWVAARDEFAEFQSNSERPGSLPFLELLEKLRQLHFEKTASYGGAADPFENVTASAKCGVEPWRRALCDLSDCVVRMQKYANGQPVDYENALIDAANWSLICLLKLREAKRA
jgi:hypothetical protein